jgi:hypothetical protein
VALQDCAADVSSHVAQALRLVSRPRKSLTSLLHDVLNCEGHQLNESCDQCVFVSPCRQHAGCRECVSQVSSMRCLHLACMCSHTPYIDKMRSSACFLISMTLHCREKAMVFRERAAKSCEGLQHPLCACPVKMTAERYDAGIIHHATRHAVWKVGQT